MTPAGPSPAQLFKPSKPSKPSQAPKAAVPTDDFDDQAPDFAGFAMWTAATLGGLVTAALVSRAPGFRALARRFGWLGPARPKASRPPAWADGPARPTPEEALPMLADAIIGNSKSAIVRVFGPPHGAALSHKAPAPQASVPADGLYWLADTWYYPLPRNRRLAMAIQFADDLARDVEFLRAPGV